jgi:hypothetical protein
MQMQAMCVYAWRWMQYIPPNVSKYLQDYSGVSGQKTTILSCSFYAQFLDRFYPYVRK